MVCEIDRVHKNIEEHKLIDEIIQKFCSATASKVNNSKCLCIKFNPARTADTLYPLLTYGHSERYLGFNFNHMGIQSKVFEINDRLQILMKQNKTISSTLKGRSAILKSYLLSQLTYHLYINHIAESKKMEDAASDYLFSKKWLMSKTRAGCDIDKGGLNFWDLKLRCSAQKAWVYENHLKNYEDSKLNKISSPFTMAWLLEAQKNRLSHIHKTCRKAWQLLFKTKDIPTSHTPTPAFDKQVKLKQLYTRMKDIQNPNWNTFKPTPGQKVLMEKWNCDALPFDKIKNIKLIKGRDLVWRYLLKAIPKRYEDKCIHCKNTRESSEHLFFTCPKMKPKCQLITDIIATEANLGQIKWEEAILKRLDNILIANLIASIMEILWSIRNNLKFNNSKGSITTELVKYKMKIAQETAWNGTLTRINKLIRKSLITKEQENQTNLKKKIIVNLERFSKNWNSPLMQITLPDHLQEYQTLASFFLTRV
ncbi:hypothetical protein ACTA71_011481 [Dictyostelium dimigraforme]